MLFDNLSHEDKIRLFNSIAKHEGPSDPLAWKYPKIDDVPEHVKQYGKSVEWKSTGKSKVRSWF